MLPLLFNPSGTATRGDTLRGAMFLCALLFVTKASGRVSLDLLAGLTLIGLLTWYMWFALFAKGYRAAGKPPAAALLPLAALVLPSAVLDGIVQGMVAPDAALALQTATTELVAERGIVKGALAVRETGLQEALVEATAVPVAIVRAAYAFGVAWLFARMVPVVTRPHPADFN